MIWKAQFLEDEAFSSSSDFNKNHSAKFCRLNSSDGKANWSSKSNDLNQWIQVDLGKTETISAVAVQGRFNNPQWVTKYNLLISDDLKNWETFENNEGVHDQESVSIFQFPSNIQGRYIRFLPLEWHGHISMRVDVAITNEKIEWIAKIIDDSAFSSSSDFNEDHSARFSRLHSTSGKANWSAKVNDRNQWLQVDLGKLEFIVAVAVQGRFNHKQWVSRYSLQISTDLEKWEKFENISGSSDQEKVSEFHLPKSIQGRYVRFLPQEWHKHISMRIDVGLISAGKLSNEDVKKSPSDLKLGNVDEKSNKATQEKDWAEAKEIAMKLAKLKADLISKNEAEEKANKEAAIKLANEVAAKAKREAEEKAKAQKEAAEKARKEAELKAQKEAEDKKKNEFVPISTSKTFQPFFTDIFNTLKGENKREYSKFYEKIQIDKSLEKLCDILDFFDQEDFILTHAPFDSNVIMFIDDYFEFDKGKSSHYAYLTGLLSSDKPKRVIELRKRVNNLVFQVLTRLNKENKFDIFSNKYYLRNIINLTSKDYPDIHAEIAKWVKSNHSKLPKIHSEYYYFSELNVNGFNKALMLNQEFKNRIRSKKQAFCADFKSDNSHVCFFKSASFIDVFNIAKSTNDNNFHFGNYVYVKPGEWSEIQFKNHLKLLEFMVNWTKKDLSDELYIDKMEFKKRFGQ